MLTIRKMVSHDLSETIKLLDSLWDAPNYKEALRIFRFKYGNEIEGVDNLLFVALSDDKIVGFRGLSTELYEYNDKKLIVASLSDAIVHSDVQRQGIFSKLTQYALEYIVRNTKIVAILTLTSNVKSTSGYKKLGWKDFSERISYYAINFYSSWMNLRISQDTTIGILNFEDFEELVRIERLHKIKKIVACKEKEIFERKYNYSTSDYLCVKLYKNSIPINYCIFRLQNDTLKIMEIGNYISFEIKKMIRSGMIYTNVKWISLFQIESDTQILSILQQSFTFNTKNRLVKLLRRKANPVRLIKAVDDNILKLGLPDSFIQEIYKKENWIIEPVNSDSFFM